jgi:hypothetical protein
VAHVVANGGEYATEAVGVRLDREGEPGVVKPLFSK